jgi:hypothetical protein
MVFDLECAHCPGDGVVRPARPGIDWLYPCSCEARRSMTNYQLARVIHENPKTIVRVAHCRAGLDVCVRVLHKLVMQSGLIPWAPGLR